MSQEEQIFELDDLWGSRVVLTQEDWNRIVAKRPGVEAYVGHVERTLRAPSIVFEGRYRDTKVFYGKGLLDEDPLYRGCYVAVVVRYAEREAGSLRTVYFPYNVQAKLGTLLHFEL